MVNEYHHSFLHKAIQVREKMNILYREFSNKDLKS